MTDESPPPSTPDPEPNPNPSPLIHPRRVSFEHGLLPIQKLVFADPIQTLAPVKQKLTESASNNRVGSAAIADVLQISGDHARLVLETLGSVLHSESDPLVGAKPEEVDSVGADLRDLVLFLYIQSYKKLLPRTHKDSAAVADVWPSTSAFDGYLSALSPIQLVRSNSRRFMPSQADDEAHQLSYLQKHVSNIVSLLAEPVEGEGEESLVLSMEAFEHLGFLVQFGDKGSDVSPLSQATPFFANSDPDMPAVPVPASQVHDWLLQNIASALESIAERISGKENGPSDQDDTMSDASAAPDKVAPSGRGPCLIEGVSKTSLVKQASDLRGRSVKVVNCHDSVIYLLAPLRYATVHGCSDTTIVLGAVGKALRVEHCERVHVIAASKRVCIANCRECVFFLGVNQRPLIVGDNHKLQVGTVKSSDPPPGGVVARLISKDKCQKYDRSKGQHGLTVVDSVRSHESELRTEHDHGLTVVNPVRSHDHGLGVADSVRIQDSEIQPSVATSLPAGSDDCIKETDEDSMQTKTSSSSVSESEQKAEILQQLSGRSVEESCIIVDRDDLHCVFPDMKENDKHKPYKKIRDAISSRMKQNREKEYKRLARQWYAEDVENGREGGDSSKQIEEDQSPEESEWELL